VLALGELPDRQICRTRLSFPLHYNGKRNAALFSPRGYAARVAVDVTVEQRIERPRDEVARFAMDPANDTRWILALDSARVLPRGPGGAGGSGPGGDYPGELGIGTRVERLAGFLGRRIEYVNEIEEYDPPRRLAMRSVKAPFPMTVVYEFEEVGDGATLARIRAGGDARGFYSVAGPLLNQMVRRGIRRDLEALKDLMERRWGGVAAEG
jgi:polyketide cyclase/dehydrase/lipid transport protein